MKFWIIFFFPVTFLHGQNLINSIASGAENSEVIESSIGEIFVVEVEVKTNSASNESISITQKKEVVAYPNPLMDFVNFVGNTDLTGQTIYLYDINGRKLLTTKINNTGIDLSELTTGLYIIKFQSNDFNPIKILKE